MNKNDQKIKIFENFQKKTYHMLNTHHSSKFQIDSSIFDPKN